MTIGRGTLEDMEGINRLLKQVLMVHHEGRPDLFKTEAIAFYKSCGMTDRIRRMEYRLED